jgi:WhiB family redox-sensing transcriptional regulator
VIAVFAVSDLIAVSTGSDLDGLTESLVPPCSDAPDQFFSERPDDLEQAKLLCRVCPIREACLEGALARREPWGVWGGQVFDRGRVITHKRGPGRPRKTDVAPAALSPDAVIAAATSLDEVTVAGREPADLVDAIPAPRTADDAVLVA